MALSEQEATRLEWAIREYIIVTEHAMELLAKANDEDLPATISEALVLLAQAVEMEWSIDPRD